MALIDIENDNMVKLFPSFNRNKHGKAASAHPPLAEPPPTNSVDRSTSVPAVAVDGQSVVSLTASRSKPLHSSNVPQQEIPLHMRRRYRGFSTSISALFLDEQVVCSAVACFGILASRRTEYLLEMRNTRRGVANQTIFSSSNIVSISFVVTIAAVSLTYLIWGSSSTTHNTHSVAVRSRFLNQSPSSNDKFNTGFIQIRMYHRFIWDPIILYFTHNPPIHDIYNSTTTTIYSRSLYYENQTHSNVPILLRVVIILLFLFVLGILGRQRRLRVRYDMIKTRVQEDRMMMQQASSNTMDRESYLQDVETASQGACSHTLLGCYPVDRKESFKSTEDSYEENVSERCFSIISYLCCGCFFQRWIQFFSCCALAQEAREVRLLVPPRTQRIDLITNQPFDHYYKDIYTLRRGWKGLHRPIQGWSTHMHALSLLSNGLVIVFSVGVTTVTLAMMFNPIFSFTLGDAFVILFTFGQSFLVLGIVHGIFHKSDLSLDAVIKFFSFGFLVATPAAIVVESIILNLFIAFYYVVIFILTIFMGGNLQSFGDEDYYFGFLIAMAIVESYFVAALSEEFCKYYTFRTIEHPDLIFLTGLDRSKKDDSAILGGNDAYPYSLENASALVNRNGSFDADYAQASKAAKNYRGFNPIIRDISNESDEEPEVRTINQQAAAVTTALISTAVGLACAENFLYVFVLSRGTSTKEEFVLLLFRSLFPVHALCAALQSTSIVRKFLEKDEIVSKRMGVGRIVLPAILLHGTFDLVIMIVNICIETYSSSQSIINVIGGCCLIVVMVGGTMWYYMQNRQQSLRLKTMSAENHIVKAQYMHPLPPVI